MLDAFVKQVRASIARDGDHDVFTTEIATAMKELAADQSWVDAGLYAADHDQGFGITILHEEPDEGFFLETVCWLPGRGVAPHDHQTWGIVVGIDGEEVNVDWRRTDDQAVAGQADLEVAEEIRMTRGTVKVLRPDDIHSIRNESDGPSLSLHLYGRNLARVDRSEFNPVTGTVAPCPKRVRRSE